MYTYDASQVAVIYGSLIIPDFEEITIDSQEDRWAFQAGSSGESTRSKNSNKLTTVTISILQTKKENLQLSALFEADSSQPLTVKDNNGNSLHFLTGATIQKMPAVTYNKSEAGANDWIIIGDASTNIAGGN